MQVLDPIPEVPRDRTSATRRRRPGLRLVAWLVGSLLILFSAVLLAEWAGWPFLRVPVQQQMQKRLQAPVSLQAPFRMQLLWRPSLAVGQVRMGAAPGVGGDRLLDAEALLVRWRWGDLWSHEPGRPWLLRELTFMIPGRVTPDHERHRGCAVA